MPIDRPPTWSAVARHRFDEPWLDTAGLRTASSRRGKSDVEPSHSKEKGRGRCTSGPALHVLPVSNFTALSALICVHRRLLQSAVCSLQSPLRSSAVHADRGLSLPTPHFALRTRTTPPARPHRVLRSWPTRTRCSGPSARSPGIGRRTRSPRRDRSRHR